MVVVRFKSNANLSREIVNNFCQPFQGLAKMGVWGGFAGDTHPPPQSTMALVDDGVVGGAGDVRWLYEVTNVHPGLAYVIQNIVHHIHLNFAHVKLLEIHAPWLMDGGIVSETPLNDYEPYPFIVNYDPEDVQVTFDAEFVDRQDPNVIHSFIDGWNGWIEVARFGGFCSDDVTPEMTKFYGEELGITSVGIGTGFTRVFIDDSGWYCLINMVQTLHHRIAAISEVTIE